ncbi:MAG: hypothetical protein IKT86_07050 [Bacteroidaceae bacterium]|nr:hypothetical protein [Bacteroidaceae bacterium]
MKRFVLFSLVCLLCGMVQAEYIPNTMWPYVYEDFTQGELVLKNGDKVRAAFNVHLLEGELHYLKDDKILFVATSRVKEVKIGDESYVPAEGKMMKVIAQDSTKYLLQCMLGDFEALVVGTGAYGASANTQAVRNLSSLEIGGKNIINHAMLLQNKDAGKELPIVTHRYFVIGDKCILATKKEVEKHLISNEESWSVFLKENKIKWRKDADLIKVLNFL